MKLRKILIFPLLFLGILSSCQSGDNRVLGSIQGKSYTVDGLLSMFLDPQAIAEAKKNITDQSLSSAFNSLATMIIFAGEANKAQFFDKGPMKQEFDKQKKAIYHQAYRKYIDETVIAPILAKVSLSDEDLAPYKKRVQVRHILLSKDGSMRNAAKGQALEQKILKELAQGAKFEDLAKKYSEDPGTKDSGGLISGWIYTNSSFDEAFKKAAMNATSNHQIIPDVKSQFGTHIIYVENLQDRSVSDIRKDDSQLVNQVLEEKKGKAQEKFYEDLLTKFSVEPNKNLDFNKYFNSYSKSQGNVVLFTINKTIPYTGTDFINDLFQGDDSKLKKAIQNYQRFQQAKSGSIDMEKIVKMVGVTPIVEEIYAKEQGIDKEPKFQKSIYLPLLSLESTLYLQDLIKKKGPKADKMPVFSVSDKEIQNFYDTNKAMFTSVPEKKGAPAVVTPLTNNLKADIRKQLLSDKAQQFQQNESKKKMDFVQKEAEALYGEYQVVPNKNFLKEEDKTPKKS